MSIECYKAHCRYHSSNYSDDGPFCDELECKWEEHISLKIKETAKQFNVKCEDCATLTEIIHCMIEKIQEDEIKALKEENKELRNTIEELYSILHESLYKTNTKKLLDRMEKYLASK